MRKKDIQYFKNLLQDELEVLMIRANSAVGELIGEAYVSEADPLDRAVEELARNNRLRFKDRESRLIAKIQNCLLTIEEGTYGICQECEEPIAIARLRARPVTSYCIDCKTKQEAFERLTGT